MFGERLRRLADRHELRHLRILGRVSGPMVSIEGRPVVLMASNDYLGLASHPDLKRAAIDATTRYGVGAGASRLVSGSLAPHHDLEAGLAAFKGCDAALVFGSGYLANLGTIPALVGAGGVVFADRLCHASLIDGCRLSGADLRVYRHRDVEQLTSLLGRRSGRQPTLIVTDGVFSMDGDLAPLPALVELAELFEASLFVDDAHGTGVLGAGGRGTLEHFGLESRISFHMGTLSKALGTSGGFLAGTSTFVTYLINTARSFMYTTAIAPATAAAALAAVNLVVREPDRRARLWENRRKVWEGLSALGYRLAESSSPIIPIIVGEAEAAVGLAERLLALGVYAPAIRPPTVPKGTSRIRVTVSSEHTAEQLDQALAAFRRAGEELRLLSN